MKLQRCTLACKRRVERRVNCKHTIVIGSTPIPLLSERGDYMARVGIPYVPKHLTGMPAYMSDEYDPTANGVRDKPKRFAEIVAHNLSITADAIHWDVSGILPEMPPLTIEQYTQSSGWGALILRNGKYHFVSGICAGFIGEWTEYFMPVGIIVSNPYSKDDIDGEYYFGKDAVLLRNDTYMQGLYPVICPRAEMMVETNISILIGAQNLRIINMIKAATDSMKEAALFFFKQIRWGRNGIITGKDSKHTWSGGDQTPVVENLPTGGVPANYMVQLIETYQFLKGTLCNDLGLQYNSNMKREALNDAETTMNDDVLHPLIDNMMECRKRFVQECKEVFGIIIPEPELSGAWKRRKAAAEAVEEAAENPEEPEQQDSEPEQKEGDKDVSEDDNPA